MIHHLFVIVSSTYIMPRYLLKGTISSYSFQYGVISMQATLESKSDSLIKPKTWGA